MNDPKVRAAAQKLAELYDLPFGGKARGRFRISVKHLKKIMERRRLYAEDILALQRALFEIGYVMIDMESFYILLSQRTFTSYRRVNDACVSDGCRTS